MSDTHHHADGEPSVSKARRVHMNSGPQLNDRLESFWPILAQQGVLQFDQAQRILGRLSPEPDKMKQPGILSTERTRKLLRPWIDEGVLLYRAYYVRQKGVFWLTNKGYKYAKLNLRYYEPTPSRLPHLIAVNEVRFVITERRPYDTWRSEREIRAEQNALPKGRTPPHVPDAELVSANGNVRAIEVELTLKSEKRLEEIVYDLAANKRYNVIWYFAPENVYHAVAKAVRTLPPEARKRFAFYTLKGELYESRPATQSGKQETA
jgi:hypothetical protein